MDMVERYVGKLFDRRYQINRVIGVGGMAVVFEAQDIVLNRKVALKMLRDEISGDEQAVRRFVNESRAVSMLSHPNIVKIFDVSVRGNLKYIVMERVEGITLKSYMQKKGALTTEEVLSYSEQVLRALDHAHSKGIIHRDIKPQNILLLKNGKVKVTDFGIAKLPNAEAAPMNEKAIGTVYYVSPEQASGKEIDGRSDLYSVGVLMYEMATGALPFNADTPGSVALMQVTEQPKAPSEIKPDIPRGLEQIILGAMEKNPDRRFQSAAQMLRYIERLNSNPGYVFRTQKETPDGQGPLGNNMKKKKKSSKRTRRQSHSMFPIILGVSFAFGIVMIVSLIMGLDMVLKNQNANTPTSVEVPGVVGSVYGPDVEKLFDSRIFKLEIEPVYDAGYPENTVIEQEPAGGEMRKVLPNKQYCTVKLTVSRGAETLRVPDYSMLEYRSVRIAAEKLGFQCVVEGIDNEMVPVGNVVYTNPAAGTQVEHGSTLTIYYSKGTTVMQVTVPKLTDLTPKEAYERMNGELRVGEVTYDYSETVPAGYILSQSLTSGVKVVKGSTVNFVISLGPRPETGQTPGGTDPGGTTPGGTTPGGTTPGGSDQQTPVNPESLPPIRQE